LPILHGLAVAAGALILAFVLACVLSTSFFLLLLLYLVLTSHLCIQALLLEPYPPHPHQ
jgi:hypothetical protein